MKTRTIPLLVLTLSGSSVGAQQVVPVSEEPMHRLMLETEAFQILDPLIMPGDTTLFHRHDVPIHYVMISPSFANAQALGEPWPETGIVDQLTRAVGEAWWTLEYAEHPLVHRVTNIGTTPFRLIAVTNLGGSRSPGPRADARRFPHLPGTIEAESAWFERSRVTVEADRAVVVPPGPDPVVVIQVSPGRIDAFDEDSAAGSTDAVGGWLVLDAETRHELRSSVTEGVTVVLVEVLRE